MNLSVNPSDPTPIYRQIERQISQAIARGQLTYGEPLMPERELAERLVVSPRSVRRAYEELESEGVCRRGSAETFLVVRMPERESRKRRLSHLLERPLEREAFSEELQLAWEIQQRLLPPAEINRDSFSIASRSSPAGVVSGDFHDVILRRDGLVSLVVADVAGKGFAAALIMSGVKAMLPYIVNDTSVGEALRELNQRLCADLVPREFVALVLTRFDPASGRLSVANAGMPDPYLLAPGCRPEALQVPGPRLPLGLRRRVDYQSRTLTLARGDRLLLYSDGIPEAKDEHDEPLGYEALSQLLGALEQGPAAARPHSPSRCLDRLLEEIWRVSSADDDWTILLLESR